MCETVAFAEIQEKYHNFLNKKTAGWDLKILFFNYWNDLVWSSVENFFLEVGGYMSQKRATAVVWEGCFCGIWVMCHNFLNIKTGKWDLNVLLFNYWKDLLLVSVETYFLEVAEYVSLKRAAAGVLEGRFCTILVKILHLFKYKSGRFGPKDFIVELLKWSLLRLSRTILLGSRCIRVSETSPHWCVRGLFLQKLRKNTTIF